MRCILCKNFSILHICKSCQEIFLVPSIVKKELIKGFYVISFYKYEEIDELIKTKHSYLGAYIFKIIANNSLRLFAKEFKQKAFAVPIDDRIIDGYSHTAILANSLKSKFIKPVFNSLLATNRVKYAGMSLEFRLKNPRNFIYNGKKGDIILVDDIVTTGTTLKEAYTKTKKEGANPLFALTLAYTT
jgi:competence protein ComFC